MDTLERKMITLETYQERDARQKAENIRQLEYEILHGLTADTEDKFTSRNQNSKEFRMLYLDGHPLVQWMIQEIFAIKTKRQSIGETYTGECGKRVAAAVADLTFDDLPSTGKNARWVVKGHITSINPHKTTNKSLDFVAYLEDEGLFEGTEFYISQKRMEDAGGFQTSQKGELETFAEESVNPQGFVPVVVLDIENDEAFEFGAKKIAALNPDLYVIRTIDFEQFFIAWREYRKTGIRLSQIPFPFSFSK